MACAPSEDSDEPGHLPNLRVFAVHLKTPCVLSYPYTVKTLIRLGWRHLRSLATHCAHSEDWSDWAEDTLSPLLPTVRTAKTLIRLGRFPGWSESSLGAQVILLVLSCGGSFQIFTVDFAVSQLLFWYFCALLQEKIFLPRYMKMGTDQEWTNVWPTAHTFKWSVVPFPVRQGAIKVRPDYHEHFLYPRHLCWGVYCFCLSVCPFLCMYGSLFFRDINENYVKSFP